MATFFQNLDTFVEKLKSLLFVGAFSASVISGAAWVSRPYWQPFADLPEQMINVQNQLLEIQTQLASQNKPRVFDIQGLGIVVTKGPILPGQAVQIGYSLRRNVPCGTDIVPVFINVDTGVHYRGKVTRSTQTPVAKDFSWFSIPIFTPSDLPFGRYTYQATARPIDCGVYKEFKIEPSQIFEVGFPTGTIK